MNNLSAHNGGRNPLVGAGNRVLGVNNIAYNTGDGVGSSGPFMVVAAAQGNGAPHYGVTAPWKVVWIGNIGIRGPAQRQAIEPTIRLQGGASGSQFYVSDNIGQGITDSSGNCTTGGQWNGVGVANINVTTGQPLTKAMICIGTLPSWYGAFRITARSTAGDNGLPGGRSAARDYVLANVGARPLDRDSVDARVVLDVKNGTGRIITREGDVGGFPVLAQNRRILTVPANPNAVVDAVGRTVIEAWLETFARALEPASQLLSAPALVAPTDLRILQ
jgi:hypothetical protein